MSYKALSITDTILAVGEGGRKIAGDFRTSITTRGNSYEVSAVMIFPVVGSAMTHRIPITVSMGIPFSLGAELIKACVTAFVTIIGGITLPGGLNTTWTIEPEGLIKATGMITDLLNLRKETSVEFYVDPDSDSEKEK
jgi:hypothetical protein